MWEATFSLAEAFLCLTGLTSPACPLTLVGFLQALRSKIDVPACLSLGLSAGLFTGLWIDVLFLQPLFFSKTLPTWVWMVLGVVWTEGYSERMGELPLAFWRMLLLGLFQVEDKGHVGGFMAVPALRRA